jgi:hypothetical protein
MRHVYKPLVKSGKDLPRLWLTVNVMEGIICDYASFDSVNSYHMAIIFPAGDYPGKDCSNNNNAENNYQVMRNCEFEAHNVNPVNVRFCLAQVQSKNNQKMSAGSF